MLLQDVTTVSFFGGRGKKTAWGVWKVYTDVTPAFCALAARPTPQTIDTWLERVERFVVLLYDRTSNQMCVNSARKEKGRTIDGLPPTKAALVQHIMRAAYQAGSLLVTDNGSFTRAAIAKSMGLEQKY